MKKTELTRGYVFCDVDGAEYAYNYEPQIFDWDSKLPEIEEDMKESILGTFVYPYDEESEVDLDLNYEEDGLYSFSVSTEDGAVDVSGNILTWNIQ